MANYPKDQFDDIPVDLARVGAHRAPAKPGKALAALGWAALVCVVFIVAGLYFLNVLRDQLAIGDDTGVTASVAPTAEPVLDPTTIEKSRNITITVLNASPQDGVEKTVFKFLKKAKWPVGASALASDRTQPTTVVYYSLPQDEDVARGIVLALGVGEVREGGGFIGAPVTVVLGADYLAAKATPSPTNTDN
jgi:hypothetical protein